MTAGCLPVVWMGAGICAVAWALAEGIVAREIAGALREKGRRKLATAAALCVGADLYFGGLGVAACLGFGPGAWGGGPWGAFDGMTAAVTFLLPLSLVFGCWTGLVMVATGVTSVGMVPAWSIVAPIVLGVALVAAPVVRWRLLAVSPRAERWKTALVLLATHLPLLPLVPAMMGM